MPDIQSLALRAQDLSRSVDWWNTAMIWTLVFAALAAAAVVIATRTSIIKAKDLSIVQGQIDKVKDDQLLRDLKDKDLRIEELRSESASLLKQLMAQGPRSYLLYGQARDRIVEALKPYKGQSVEIRHCEVAMNQFHIDNDAMGVVMLLDTIFKEAKWQSNSGVRENCDGSGMQVSVDPKSSESTRKAADALLSALLAVPFAVVGNRVLVMESPRNLPQPKIIDCGTGTKCENKEVPLAPLKDTIVLTVLAHP